MPTRKRIPRLARIGKMLRKKTPLYRIKMDNRSIPCMPRQTVLPRRSRQHKSPRTQRRQPLCRPNNNGRAARFCGDADCPCLLRRSLYQILPRRMKKTRDSTIASVRGPSKMKVAVALTRYNTHAHVFIHSPFPAACCTEGIAILEE